MQKEVIILFPVKKADRMIVLYLPEENNVKTGNDPVNDPVHPVIQPVQEKEEFFLDNRRGKKDFPEFHGGKLSGITSEEIIRECGGTTRHADDKQGWFYLYVFKPAVKKVIKGKADPVDHFQGNQPQYSTKNQQKSFHSKVISYD